MDLDWSEFEADYDVIRDRIEAVFPDLFHDFNRRIRQPGGFHLRTPPRERVWNTPTGRANFLIFEGVAEDPAVVNKSMLRLTTLRSHNQYNTTIYGLDDRYRGVFGGRMVVFMNERDMKQRDIAPGSLVEIESIASDGQAPSRAWLQGVVLRDPARIGRCLLPGNQSTAAARFPRRAKQNAGGEINPGPGPAGMNKTQSTF